jgi:hypothetical protein
VIFLGLLIGVTCLHFPGHLICGDDGRLERSLDARALPA